MSFGLALLALFVTVESVFSFEFLGLKLFEDQSDIDAEAVMADPQPYSATLRTSAIGPLESRIRDASNLLTGQTKPANGAAGLLATARADYKRILSALYDEGYYGGAISILVGERFSVEANGNADSVDVLKQAVASVDAGRLEGLAR